MIYRKDTSGRNIFDPVFRNHRFGAFCNKWNTVRLLDKLQYRTLQEKLDYLEEVNTLLSAYRNI